MVNPLGRWLRHIDAWFFRLTDGQRVGVVLGVALFLFSSALYCLGISSVILLQRPYEVSAAVEVMMEPEAEPEEVEIVEIVSTPTQLPTPTQPAPSSPLPTPIAAIEIAEPPAVPRPSSSEPPARPRVVGPDIRPEAPSQRLPTAVPARPTVAVQPTAVTKPNNVVTAAPTAALPARGATAPTATAVSKQPPSAAQPTAAPKVITAIPNTKPAAPTLATRSQAAPTATSR
jgi:hypothetical protein